MSTVSQAASKPASDFDIQHGDSLDDILGVRSEVARAPVAPPASYQPQDFTEPCPKCRGTGRFTSYSGRAMGQCFTCKGAGKRTFKTSRETRQRSAENAAQRVARKAAEAVEDFKIVYPEIWTWMDGSDFPFAVSLRQALGKWGALTDNQITAAQGCIAKLAAAKEASKARTENAPIADAAGIDRLKAAFDSAIAYSAAKGKGLRLRNPKITIGSMVISPAKATSANAGALYVKSGEQYLGKISGGKFFASRECSPDQSAKVLAFVADPGGAAKAYGQETGVCCVCNATLRSEWRLRGIGPICAEKYGW